MGLDGADKHVGTALRHRKMSAARQRRFLGHLTETCNAVASAKAAGLSISTFYVHRQADASFRAVWEEAIRAGYDRLEEALLARALAELQRGDTGSDTGTDAGAVDGAAPAGKDAGRVAGRLADKVTLSGVQLGLQLLNRRQAAEKRGAGGRRRASAQEVEAALGAKLDSLARRLDEPER